MRGRDVKIEWMPFELRPQPTETLKPDGEYLQRAWKESVYPLAEQFGIDIRLPQVSPQPYTFLAHQGLQFAREQGRADEFNHAVFRAFFQESRDIGNADVLTDIAAEVGADANKFRSAVDDGTYAELVRTLERHALEEARIIAVPTFLFGKKRAQGLYPADVLGDAIDEEIAKLKKTG